MLDDLHFAYGAPSAMGVLKANPEDFCVVEDLGFEPSGAGEHLFLLVEKTLLNTEDMVNIISESFNLPKKVISYAGLKDKYAKTTQWFSLHLPGLDNPSLDAFHGHNFKLLNAVRHHKKLKIGALKGNHFVIRLSDFRYEEPELLARIDQVRAHGVPNYFGPQRFGNQGSNVDRAKALLLEHKKIKSRHLRGIVYSAARSLLFNHILSHRVLAGNWNRPIEGDLMMLAGTHSVFAIDTVDDEIDRRIDEHDIFPAAPLWGQGKELLSKEALRLQTAALEPWSDWCDALEAHGLQKLYRTMVLLPENLQWNKDIFSFSLPTGAYATTVLRELIA